MKETVLRLLCMILVLVTAACSGGPPTVKIIGGGFIFNYRIAEAHYGIVAEIGGVFPDGAVLEAAFEDPAGGAAIVVTQAIVASRPRYKMETPPLTGIEAGRPYQVTLRLLASGGGKVLAETMRAFKSNVGQELLPERPLSVGPGYHRPPETNPDNQ